MGDNIYEEEVKEDLVHTLMVRLCEVGELDPRWARWTRAEIASNAELKAAKQGVDGMEEAIGRLGDGSTVSKNKVRQCERCFVHVLYV